MHGDLSMIKNELQGRCVDVCRILLPQGHIDGRLYVAHDPIQGDFDRKPALKVRLSGNIGGWASFRGGADAARHDILGLIEYINGTDTKGALAWARDFLGLRKMSSQERANLRKKSAVAVLQQAKQRENRRLWIMNKAKELFVHNTISVMQAPHALAYFAGRKIPLEQIGTFAGRNFRFSAKTEYWRAAKYQTDQSGRRYKTQCGPDYPAIHSAIRNIHGNISACHITYLDTARPVKAAVECPKLMFGEVAGSIIEVSTGKNMLSFWECGSDKSSEVIVCEGIETGLSLALAIPECRVWAATSITNMGNAPVSLNCVSSTILARDNNYGNPVAQKQIEQIIDRLEHNGKPLAVINSPIGDDFNDLMKGDNNGTKNI